MTQILYCIYIDIFTLSFLYNTAVLSHFSCVQLFANRMDCRPPGSFVHGILQARILEWVPFLPPGDLPNPGIKPMSLMSPALAGGSSYQHYSSPNSRRIPYTHRQFQHPQPFSSQNSSSQMTLSSALPQSFTPMIMSIMTPT